MFCPLSLDYSVSQMPEMGPWPYEDATCVNSQNQKLYLTVNICYGLSYEHIIVGALQAFKYQVASVFRRLSFHTLWNANIRRCFAATNICQHTINMKVILTIKRHLTFSDKGNKTHLTQRILTQWLLKQFEHKSVCNNQEIPRQTSD